MPDPQTQRFGVFLRSQTRAGCFVWDVMRWDVALVVMTVFRGWQCDNRARRVRCCFVGYLCISCDGSLSAKTHIKLLPLQLCSLHRRNRCCFQIMFMSHCWWEWSLHDLYEEWMDLWSIIRFRRYGNRAKASVFLLNTPRFFLMIWTIQIFRRVNPKCVLFGNIN